MTFLTPPCACPFLLLLPLLIVRGGECSSSLLRQEQGTPSSDSSDEVDYIPKEVVRPAASSTTGRLPNILTSLELPPSYLEEVLRSDDPPRGESSSSSADDDDDRLLQHRRLYQPRRPPPQPQEPVRRYFGRRKHGQYYNGVEDQQQKSHHPFDVARNRAESQRSRDKTVVVKTQEPEAQLSWGSPQAAPTEEPGAAETQDEVETTSKGPRFDRTLPRRVTVQAGKTAVLTCRVFDNSEKSVSWMRHEDLHILSVGKYKYSTDERVSVALDSERQEWLLTIQRVGLQDSGMYECQVSTKPVLSFIVSLEVVVPRAEVVNGPEIFVHRGSLINLTCVVTHGTQRPVYVYWYHHNKVLDYEGRGGVTVITKASRNTVSHLLMRAARPEDSGLYSCRPSNGQEASATLHVLNGEHQAAMQSDAGYKIFASPIVILLGVWLKYILQLHLSNIDGQPLRLPTEMQQMH